MRKNTKIIFLFTLFSFFILLGCVQPTKDCGTDWACFKERIGDCAPTKVVVKDTNYIIEESFQDRLFDFQYYTIPVGEQIEMTLQSDKSQRFYGCNMTFSKIIFGYEYYGDPLLHNDYNTSTEYGPTRCSITTNGPVTKWDINNIKIGSCNILEHMKQ